ncbi:hypothetical protein [Motilimonas sp. KMU-193]|uniref:hypothetical protein n=1 Tax=Motilimonas sp. KMU-193 TaxID=3388668 RepID=UPI00396B397B
MRQVSNKTAQEQAAQDSRRKFLIRGSKLGVGLPLVSSFFSRSAMGAGTCYTASAAHSLAPSTAREPESCIASGRSPGYYKVHVGAKVGDEWNLGWPAYGDAHYYCGAENGIPRYDKPSLEGINDRGLLTNNGKSWFQGTLNGAMPVVSVSPVTLLGEISCFASSPYSNMPIMEVLWQKPGSEEFIGIATYFNIVHLAHHPELTYPIDFAFGCELIEAMLEGRDDDYNLPSFANGSIKTFLDSLYV